MTGGAGADTFEYHPHASGDGNDTITDFTNGEDRIRLDGYSTISEFSDLTVTSDDEGVTIDLTEHGGGTIRLEGFNVDDLDASDFRITPPVAPPPVFAQQGYIFEVAENTDGAVNRVSLGTVLATDPEGRALTYSLTRGSDSGLFEIDAASGELFYTGPGDLLDYESGSTEIDLFVRATNGFRSTVTQVTLNITDVEEDDSSEEPVIAQPQQSEEEDDSSGEPAVEQPQESVSELAGEDFTANTSTAGTVAVGGAATGDIGTADDVDWFAVELLAGRTYTIDLRGRPTADGTLSDPYLRGIYDADGNLIANTINDDDGEGLNSRLTFTATESGTHYIAAGSHGLQGTYEVEVTDNAGSTEPPATEDSEPPVFGQQGYTFELAENADGSTDRVSLGRVSATDPENAAVTYSFVGGNGSGSFEIDAASGELFYTGAGEDYESGTTQFDLTVRASDGDQSTDTTVTVTVTVNVTDVEEQENAESPVTEQDQSTVQTVSEPAGEDFSADTSTAAKSPSVTPPRATSGAVATAIGSRSSWWRAGPTRST